MSELLNSQLRRSIALLERDLLRDLRCALIDAVKGGTTDEALSAALRKHRLVISRKPPRPRAKPYFIEEPLPHGDTL